MQINIQPGDNVRYKFQMHKKQPKWFDGIVLDKIHVQGESFTERTFKVYFREDKEVCDLQFDDDQYITQWNIVSPMSSPSTQQTTQPISEQANGHIQAATDEARNKLDAQLSLYKKLFKHDPQTSAPQHKNILCRLCFSTNKTSLVLLVESCWQVLQTGRSNALLPLFFLQMQHLMNLSASILMRGCLIE